ncbi:MAG: hypothetical protein ACYDA0_14335 [Candidatus Dormibacteraceae bacterium]
MTLTPTRQLDPWRPTSAGGVLVVYTVLAFALFANVWTSPGTRWIGVDGDPDSTIWSIQWTAYALVHGLNPFVTQHIFYPTWIDVLWANADAPIALAWAAAPVTLAFGAIVAYNLLQTLALALSAWCAFIAIRRYAQLAAAAMLGGLVYGFGPYMMGQAYGHLGLTFCVVPPLLLILIDRLLIRRDLSPLVAGAAAGILEGFQLLTSEEMVVTEAMVTVIALALLAALALVLGWTVPWRQTVTRLAVAGGAAAAVFAVLAAYPVYVLLRGPAPVTHHPIRVFGGYVTDLFNLVVPPGTTHLIHTGWTEQVSKLFPGAPSESGGYLGLALIGVIVFTTIRWWRIPAVIFAAGMIAAVLLVSLGPALTHGGHQSQRIILPWNLARNVPLLNEVLVDRLAVYVDLFAGLLLSIFIDRAWRSGRRFARPLAVLATAASLALLVPSLPWFVSTAHVPSVFQPGTADNRYFQSVVPPGSVAVILPADDLRPDAGYAVLWQAVDGMAFKMPEGDLIHGGSNGVATDDPEPSPLWNAMSQLQRGQLPNDVPGVLAQLQQLGVRAVVVGSMDHEQLAVSYFTTVLGRPPSQVGDVYIWSV